MADATAATDDEAPPVSFATDGRQGPWFVAEHVVRRVNIYPMTEGEISTQNLFNAIASGALSVAGFMGGVYASVWWDMRTSPDGAVRQLGDPLLSVLSWIAVVSVLVALWAQWRKGSALDEILRQSFLVKKGGEQPVAQQKGIMARCRRAAAAFRS